MMHGRNNGKKMLAVRIVKHAFEIIHLLTNEVEERERERRDRKGDKNNSTFCSIIN